MTPSDGPFSARYRLITAGAVVLVFVAAFENLAVTTVMPVIAEELDGAALYAVAFAAPLAASVLGMVVSGLWCDRTGPRAPLALSIGLFFAGLVVAGLSPSMEAVVAGRLVQGLGSGATTVALYVIVARVYPARLQPQVFGLFSAAWVIPALIGPFIAGVIGETVGWRWVFLGVAAFVVPAALMVAPAMRILRQVQTDAASRAAGQTARILWAVLLAVAILTLSVSTELEAALGYPLAVVSFVVAVVALRPLVPRGTLTGRLGLPSVVSTRLLLAGGFFATEIYLPYLLTSQHGFSPAVAGLALTVSGVFWGGASLLQGRLGARLGDRTSVRLGVTAVLLAVALVLVATAVGLPAWVVVAGWAVSGTGMGLAYPRLSVLVLAESNPGSQGFNSAALNIADAAGPAMSLAVAGILFQALGPAGAVAAFSAVFALGLALTLLALLVSRAVVSSDRSAERLETGKAPVG